MRKIKMLSTQETEHLLNWLGTVQTDEPAPQQRQALAAQPVAVHEEAPDGPAKVLYHPSYFKLKMREENEQMGNQFERKMSAPSEFNFRLGAYRIRLKSSAPYVTVFYQKKRA